jgi:hypothetical protein
MCPNFLRESLRPSVLKLRTSCKGTLVHRREVKSVPPSTCRIHTKLPFFNCQHLLRFISKSGGWLGQHPNINHTISQPLTTSTHIFIIPALVVWRHSTHLLLISLLSVERQRKGEIEKQRGFHVIPLTFLSSCFTLSCLRHCADGPRRKSLTALSLLMTNTSVKCRQTRNQTSSFAAMSAALSRTDIDHVQQQKITDIGHFCFTWSAYIDKPVDRKWNSDAA